MKELHKYIDADGNIIRLLEGPSRRKYSGISSEKDKVYYFEVNGQKNRIGIEFQILGLYYVLNNIQFPHELRKKLEMLDKHINPLRQKFL